MTDTIRQRLADAIFGETTQIVFTSTGGEVEKRIAAIMSMSAGQLADVLMSLPDIAIVDRSVIDGLIKSFRYVEEGVDLLLSLPGVDIMEVPEGMRTSVRYDRDAEITRLNVAEEQRILTGVLDALENRIKIERLRSRDRGAVNDELTRIANDDPMEPRQPYINKIYLLLADASQGTVDPDRAMNIARRAVTEACDNREGK